MAAYFWTLSEILTLIVLDFTLSHRNIINYLSNNYSACVVYASFIGTHALMETLVSVHAPSLWRHDVPAPSQICTSGVMAALLEGCQ